MLVPVRASHPCFCGNVVYCDMVGLRNLLDQTVKMNEKTPHQWGVLGDLGIYNITCAIFSLQRFKLNIANTVIGQDDSHLRDRSDLLGLFQVSGSQQQWGKDKVRLHDMAIYIHVATCM